MFHGAFECDRCKDRTLVSLKEVYIYVDTGVLPPRWFEHDGKHYCPKHELRHQPQIIDREEFL